MGDTVFDLLVRSELVCQANRPVNALHKTASTRVCAKAQAEAINVIMPMLSEDELAVFKRGRNAHTGGIPKNQITTMQQGLNAFSAGFISKEKQNA